MRTRAVGLAAAGAVIVALGAWQVGAPIASTLRTQLAVHRAGAQVAKLGLPAGLSPCSGGTPGDQSVAVTRGEEHRGIICWQGSLSPVDATVAVREALLRLGARDVSARCGTGRGLGEICDLQATLSGIAVVMSLSPQVSSGVIDNNTVFVSGGAGPMFLVPPLNVPASATPIALPAAYS